ncbi:MAG TPA: 4-alpha-glucanotransferase [Anaeromyxobacteraceae bacterium]|nr:4-alpha-glucanotransferase [Anaeromyxobacteraceae bacterium]
MGSAAPDPWITRRQIGYKAALTRERSPMPRQAGVLLPLFSIRNPTAWGLGEIPDLVPFGRWAAGAGFSVLQVLPMNEVSRGQDSPYGALSAFALDPVYLALDAMEDFAAAGGREVLSPEDQALLSRLQAAPRVHWHPVRQLKERAFQLAFRAFLDREWTRRSRRAEALEAFARDHEWLEDYALFATLHDDRFGGNPWPEWPEPLRRRDPAALGAARVELRERILYREWLQWQADLQWRAARRGLSAAGVALMGDLPFMVAGDSADVWARTGDFRLDAHAGAPPDAFSATGQDWGLPVYRWDEMGRNGHAWIAARGRRAGELYDLYRVDHVVGFYRSYYFPNDGGPPAFTPAEKPAQIRNGERVMTLFQQGGRVIAEDLGVIPDFVRASLTRLGIPGYRVLRWEKDAPVFRDPALWPALSVATTGTHDTESLADWFEGMPPEERAAFLKIPGLSALQARAPERFDEGVRDAVLELVYASGSDLVLLPFQDALGSRERVNIPGTVSSDNWSYRMPQELAALSMDLASSARLRGLAGRTDRAANPAGEAAAGAGR